MQRMTEQQQLSLISLIFCSSLVQLKILLYYWALFLGSNDSAVIAAKVPIFPNRKRSINRESTLMPPPVILRWKLSTVDYYSVILTYLLHHMFAKQFIMTLQPCTYLIWESSIICFSFCLATKVFNAAIDKPCLNAATEIECTNQDLLHKSEIDTFQRGH